MADPELKWWHVRWGMFGRRGKKIGLWLAIILAAGSILYVVTISVLGFFQSWFAIRNLGKDPNAWVVPKAPGDRSLASLSGARLEEYGYSIQTPWGEPSIFKGVHDWTTSVRFPSDKVGMFIRNPSEQDDLLSGYRTMPNAGKIFGKQALHSNYDMMAAEMNATPRDSKWWTGPRGNVGLLVLLVNKTVGMTEYHDIYTIESGDFKGFQLGDPEKPPHRVQLDLYDAADRHIRIDVGIFGDRSGSLTQAQINAMVASIRPVGKK